MLDIFVFAAKIIANFLKFCYNNKNTISCIVIMEVIPLTAKLYNMVIDLIFTNNPDYTKKQEAPCLKCPYGQYCYGTCVIPDDMRSNIVKGSVKPKNYSINSLVYDLT